jgi:hypothetical protein
MSTTIPTIRSRRAWLVVGGALVTLGLGCKPQTPRPPFGPITGAVIAELDVRVPTATKLVADALRADSLPVSRVELRDGWIETPWFDSQTRAPTAARRLGPGVVRIRAWLDPARPGYSRLHIETVERPLADPSLPERELEQQVPLDHPISARVQEIVAALVKQYGGADSTGP